MPTYLLFIPGAVALLIALLYLVAALFGAHIAQVNRDNRYRKAELRSEQRAREIRTATALGHTNLTQARKLQAELQHRKSMDLYHWHREYTQLLHDSYFDGVR